MLGLFELQSGSAFANVLYLYNTGEEKSSIWVLLKRGGSARKFCSVSPNLISSHQCVLLLGFLTLSAQNVSFKCVIFGPPQGERQETSVDYC